MSVSGCGVEPFAERGKKTVVDVLKRGNTFGELAIIFLIPRIPSLREWYDMGGMFAIFSRISVLLR